MASSAYPEVHIVGCGFRLPGGQRKFKDFWNVHIS